MSINFIRYTRSLWLYVHFAKSQRFFSVEKLVLNVVTKALFNILVSDTPETNRWISTTEVDYILEGREQLILKKELELEGIAIIITRSLPSFVYPLLWLYYYL